MKLFSKVFTGGALNFLGDYERSSPVLSDFWYWFSISVARGDLFFNLMGFNESWAGISISGGGIFVNGGYISISSGGIFVNGGGIYGSSGGIFINGGAISISGGGIFVNVGAISLSSGAIF